MPDEVLNTSSEKPSRWNRQIALSSSNVSSLVHSIQAWTASANTSSASYLGMPHRPARGIRKTAAKNSPANRQALASLTAKYANSTAKRATPVRLALPAGSVSRRSSQASEPAAARLPVGGMRCSAAELALLVHFLAHAQDGLDDARGGRILARAGLARDQELRDMVIEGHDIQSRGAIALGDLQPALPRIVHHHSHVGILARQLECRREHLVCRRFQDDAGEVVDRLSAALSAFPHVLDAAQRLARHQRPLRVNRGGGNDRQDRGGKDGEDDDRQTQHTGFHLWRGSRSNRGRTLPRRNRALTRIVVESALDFAADPARLDVFHQERTRPVLRIGETFVQHLHHRQASVEADEVGELEGTHRMVGTELHAGVDRLDIADTFVQRIDRFVDHGQQDAIDDEGREVLGIHRLLVEPHHHLAHRAESLLLRGNAADQLDQAHHRHGIHEMHAHELAGPVGHRRQPGHRDRRRVGRQEHIGRQTLAQLLEDLALGRLVLGRRLDDQIAVGELLVVAGGRDAPQRGVLVLRADHAAADLAIHVAPDRLETFFDVRLIDVRKTDVEAFERADMGDAAAHLAGADDAAALDHGYLYLSRGTASNAYFFSTAAVSYGTNWNRSPTMP